MFSLYPPAMQQGLDAWQEENWSVIPSSAPASTAADLLICPLCWLNRIVRKMHSRTAWVQNVMSSPPSQQEWKRGGAFQWARCPAASAILSDPTLLSQRTPDVKRYKLDCLEWLLMRVDKKTASESPGPSRDSIQMHHFSTVSHLCSSHIENMVIESWPEKITGIIR